MSPLWLAVVLAQAPLVAETKCEGFSVVVTSPSGDWLEDDGRVEVVVDGVRVPVPVAPAWFTGAGVRSRSPRLRCASGPAAFAVGEGRVVLLLSRSGRPGLDFISLALVDLAHRKTLQVLDTKWQLASGRAADGASFAFVLREAAGGFDLRAVREWLGDDDSLESAMQDWLAVRVRGERLSATWLRP